MAKNSVDLNGVSSNLAEPNSPDPLSRRDVAATLLGLLGVATLSACASGAEGQAPTDEIGQLAAALTPVTVVWVNTVLGAAPTNPVSTRPGDLATNNPTAVGATVVVALGAVTAGDGGGGIFVWSATSGTDDGGTIIVPGASTSVGSFGACWKRVFSGPLNVRWFGAKGDSTNNDQPAIQNALNVVVSGSRGGTIFFPLGVYKINSTLVLKPDPSSYVQAVNLEGEMPTGQVGGVRILWGGGVSSSVMLDCRAMFVGRIKNLTFNCQLGAKCGIWFRPDSPGANRGTSDVVVESVYISSPQNTAGGACVWLGPHSSDIVNSVSQTDTIRFMNCYFQGDLVNNPTYQADGVVNLYANNTKVFAFYNCQFAYCNYGANFAISSGPLLFSQCTGISHTKAVFCLGSGTIMIIGFNAELSVGRFIDNLGQGSTAGDLTLMHCQISCSNPSPTDDYIISWQGGHLNIVGGFYANSRNATSLPKIQTQNTANTANSKCSVRSVGVTYWQVNDHAPLYDTSGNDLLSPVYAKSTPNRATSINDAGYTSTGIVALKPMTASTPAVTCFGAGVVSSDATGNLSSLKSAAYTLTNHTTARSLNETAVTLAQLANVVGTLITDLKTANVLG